MDIAMPDLDQLMATDSPDWLTDELLRLRRRPQDGARLSENATDTAGSQAYGTETHETNSTGFHDADNMNLHYTLSCHQSPYTDNAGQVPRIFHSDSYSPLSKIRSIDRLPDNIDADDPWSIPPTSSFGTQGGEPGSSPTIINESEAISPELFEDEAPREYQLRPQSRSIKSLFPSTWIDRDETGNYGESKTRDQLRQEKERRERDARRRQARIEAAADELIDGEAGDEGYPRLVPTLPVILTFLSPTGKQRLRNFFATCKPPKTAGQGEISEGYPLRRRRSAKTSRYHTDWSFGEARSTSGPGDDLTGHPSARGCYECLSLGLRCSLLDNEESWPCHACNEDDHDCELITQPVVKRACERCKSSRNGCSFSYDNEQGVACQQCMDGEHRCVAGPAKESIRPRLSYDWDWENDPVLKKKALKLTEDPLAFKVRRERPLLVSEPVLHKSVQTHKRVQADDGAAVDFDSERSVKKPTTERGTTKTITTKFCHPIQFNHDNTNGGAPCHFCSEPAFAILGLAAKEVEVIEWKSGKALEEVSGGHAGDGVESTRICASCTLGRLSIIMCQEHKLAPIAGKKDSLDNNTATMELLSGTVKASTKWCSICPSLARYQCTTSSDGCRCRLLLCEHDMALLGGDYNGNLQAMLSLIKDEPSKERMFRLRADSEFLKQDGLLLKYVLWDSSQ